MVILFNFICSVLKLCVLELVFIIISLAVFYFLFLHYAGFIIYRYIPCKMVMVAKKWFLNEFGSESVHNQTTSKSRPRPSSCATASLQTSFQVYTGLLLQLATPS
ncbi:hypothetical protein QVD17_28057 [Tagetes erecta]|uniref:Uncharacterized protein n=1 Tax=Tagetes erecta TaxID=13708 RepID=A0AAD8NSD5_TARER|nr:hypothetical protein QVD17_28057 [Tagetes erecta]